MCKQKPNKNLPTQNCKLILFALSSFFLFISILPSAHAAGTLSGTAISNTALLQCNFCGVGISSNTPLFVVDRKVNVTVGEVSGAATAVSANQSASVTDFIITNNGNAVQDYSLTAANNTSGATLFSGIDNFDGTACIARVESGALAGYDVADTATFIDELAADASTTVYVVCNIPAGLAMNDQAIVSLTVTTLQGGAAAAQGAATTQTAGADTGGVDTVFADAGGSDDATLDGKHSARDAYRVSLISSSIAYSTTFFVEAVANNGLISTVPTLTLTGDTFTGANGVALAGGVVSNVPAGLVAVLTKTSATTVTLSFTGNATAHANANSIANLTVTLSDAAFTSGNAVTISGATTSNLVIAFADATAAIVLTESVINVQDPFGCNAASGCKIVSGSILTYRIDIAGTGVGTVDALSVINPIPLDTSYVPNSIIVNGVAKTDAADGDLTDFGITLGNTVTYTPGTVTVPMTSWFTFRTTIN